MRARGRRHNRYATMSLLVYMLVFLLRVSKAASKILDEETVQMTDTEAVAGGMAKMACDVTPSSPEDKVILVIWYKEGATSPIYSFDARGKPLDQAKHWADEQTLGGRAFFRFSDNPAKLTVENVRDSDGGVYRCRVDFKRSPTRNTKVNLTVLIPPEKLIILDEKGSNIPHYILGPYNEGSTVNITCIATGGRPSPRVTWWQANALLDDSYEQLPDRRVQNVLHLEKLERRNLHTVLTCQATNNNLIAPISNTVTLDMNLRPLWVQLLGENKPLSADNPYELACEAVGTRPPPVMSWLKGSISLRNTRESTSPDGNVTVSTLTFVPSMEDSGKILSCRAGTPLIPDSYLEDVWQLNIYHVPIVSLELGSNLNATTIREGVDVYFECNIKSNPWVYKVSWRHNGKTLFNNASMGTIVSNQSLVLQSVTRARAGIYTCVGSNQEGDGESNPVYLDVKFVPVCKSGQQKVHGVARQEAAKILCELEANPQDVHFVWKFNNTSETLDIQASHVTADRVRSVATYMPMTELDYGTLLCMGRNDLGMQKEPCVFHIIPAGKPDGLHNCTILNQTAESLHVECSEGFDGGLPQEFIMEVYDAMSQNLVTNVTSRTPVFTVNGLESGLGFDIALFASNAKGRSDPVPLHAYTLKAAEKRTGRLGKPDPPEKCTVVQQTYSSLRLACSAPSYDIPATYVLQVYDAESRHLVASSTSQTPGRLEISDLPSDRRALVLSVRTVTAYATSDALTIYTQMLKPQEQRVATPTILHITPILGVLIGVVLALVLVAVIIVVVMRLRGHNGDDEKEHEEGTSGGGHRNTCGDKASSVPLSKDTDESMDSLDEKNPDIIPQNSDTDYQDPDEKAFEKLNNAPSRIYANMTPRVQSPNNGMYDNSNIMNMPKTSDEVTYAELSLPKQQAVGGGVYASSTPHMQVHPTPIIRRQEPTVYAQIDVTKKAPLAQSQQTLAESCLQQPHPASLPLLHHHHLAAYHQPPLHMLQQHSPRMHEDEPSVNAETPLIPQQQQSQQHRESTVGYVKPESGRSSASQGPRVTATRF